MTMVFSIPKEELIFPDPHLGEPDGLLCIGGDLSPERLLLAYHHGIFPWFSFTSREPHWYCPMQRFVIFPDEVHVSHSMRQLIRQQRYRLSINEAFEAVIRFMFDEVGVNRLEARHNVDNPNSGGVMKKCGLTYEGTLRQAATDNTGLMDLSVYSILRSEYEAMG